MKILLDFDKSFKLDFKDAPKEFIACEVFYKLLLYTSRSMNDLKIHNL